MRLGLLPVILFLALTGCLDDKQDRKLLSEAAKTIARSLEQPRQTRHTQDETTPVELVSSGKQVGHRNFAAAKKVLPRVYEGLEEDFYCGCHYSGKDVDLRSCGYQARRNENRASRIEWEHVVPASHLGSQRQCWQNGGRKSCSGQDARFDLMEGDLNNLVPAVGEVNGDRGNMSYGAWTRQPERVYGQCTSVPDFRNKRFQPREEVRGRAARISLYMHTHYHLSISDQDKKLWCGWAKTYPIDEWERARNERIVRVQGEGNPLVSDRSALARVCG